MRNEVKIWQAINGHPNIVEFLDAQIHKSHEGKYLYILSEYWGDGHLLDLIERYTNDSATGQIKPDGGLAENLIILVMKQIVNCYSNCIGKRHLVHASTEPSSCPQRH
jgi:serine/threonine protein kinase